MDTQGLLLGVVVHAADIQDADGLWDLLKRLKPLYPWLRAVFADSIYNRLTALLACFLFGLTLIIVRRVEGSRGFAVQAADIQDADGLWDLLKRVKPLYPWLRAVFADSIYNRFTALLACFLFGLTLIIVRRVAGTTGFVVQPRRWVVERSLGWLGRWRRLSRDYEELPEVSEAMVTLAMIRLMLHRLVHPNRKHLPAP